MWVRPILIVCAVFALVCRTAGAVGDDGRTVVLLLFDGWAPRLMDSQATPAMQRIRAEGAWTHQMIPVFPTVSLVNQTTISTGCWPQRHGIVSNVFLDPQKGLYDHSPDADWLTGCEHLHQAAERQGVRAAALGWPGRYSTARGDLAGVASQERRFEQYPVDSERADQVIALLQLPDGERPRFLAAYFHGPDRTAHFQGIDAAATRAAVVESDRQVGRILDAIESSPQAARTTLLITTDHGMVDVSTNVNVKKILLNHGIHARFRSSGTTSFLYFDDRTQIDTAFAALSGYPQFDVVRRDEQPAAWRLGNGPRVGDLILSAHPPYFIEDIDNWPSWARWLGTWGPELLWARLFLKASHGYPPDTPGVAGIFYAWGDGITRTKLDPVRAIDIHPTAASLLGISPGDPVDGEVIQGLLSGAR